MVRKFTWSNSTIVLNNDNVEIDLSEAHQKIFKSFDAYLRERSGWVFDEVVKIDVRLANYIPLQGNCFIPTPPSIRSKHCLVNVKTMDDEEIFPLCISKFENAVEIDLLLLKDETKSHYVWIKNLSRFLSHLTKHDGVAHYCRFCLH